MGRLGEWEWMGFVGDLNAQARLAIKNDGANLSRIGDKVSLRRSLPLDFGGKLL